MAHPFVEVPELARAAADVLRPLEDLAPSEWAERYVTLGELETTQPGPWSNDVFPYLAPIMDAVKEGIETGRNVVLMKSGQGGGSTAMIVAWAYLKVYYPGPSLYLISKNEHADEFGRERFGPAIETNPQLAAIALHGREHGEKVGVKRFTTGKHVIVGGRSVLNLESQPYRVVFIDEYDSLMDEFAGKGDPLANAEIRTDAFPGPTIIVAFAHPTTEDRGAGALYYGRSDQRRAVAPCFHCGEPFWLNPEHIRVFPHGDEPIEHARRDPTCYRYITPCCGVELEDYQRFDMARKTEQVSQLDPAEAAKRDWIGLHFSQLYMSNKRMTFLARKIIEGLDDPSIARVTVNKRWGDVWRPVQRKTDPEQWRRLICIPRREGDPEYYNRGEVPPGVSFLTAGQDSRRTELHWAVWGWGLVANTAQFRELCGWLIDYGIVPVELPPEQDLIQAADLAPLGELLYGRGWARTDSDEVLYLTHGYHDTGWSPNAVTQFCATIPGDRAVPTRGDNLSSDRAPRVALHRWGKSSPPRIQGQEAKDYVERLAILNTFRLKEEWLALVPARFDRPNDQGPQTRIVLPRDVGEDFLAQSASEYLAPDGKKLAWYHRGPNHFSDCNIGAYAAARQLNPLLRGETRHEHEQKVHAKAEAAARKRLASSRRAAAGGSPYARPQRAIRRRY